MSSNFKHKIVQHFEWCTELPSIDQPRESPVFLLKNNEWFFKLVYEKPGSTWYLEIYLELKTKHTDIKTCRANYQVGFKNEATLSLGSGAFEVREHCEVWYISQATLNSKLPPDYIMGNWMKLIFSFDDVDVSVLNNPKKIGENFTYLYYFYINKCLTTDLCFSNYCYTVKKKDQKTEILLPI